MSRHTKIAVSQVLKKQSKKQYKILNKKYLEMILDNKN